MGSRGSADPTHEGRDGLLPVRGSFPRRRGIRLQATRAHTLPGCAPSANLTAISDHTLSGKTARHRVRGGGQGCGQGVELRPAGRADFPVRRTPPLSARSAPPGSLSKNPRPRRIRRGPVLGTFGSWSLVMSSPTLAKAALGKVTEDFLAELAGRWLSKVIAVGRTLPVPRTVPGVPL